MKESVTRWLQPSVRLFFFSTSTKTTHHNHF